MKFILPAMAIAVAALAALSAGGDEAARRAELEGMARRAAAAWGSERGAARAGIQNGDFEEVGSKEGGDEEGQFGEPMFAPGSKLLAGWRVADGLVGLRKTPRSPNGGNVLELGPREPAGKIAQTVRTRPGADYSLSFFASAGRPGANSRVKVRAGEQEKFMECAPARYERLVITFRATAEETEISIAGVGADGFGPMIDEIKLEEAR